MIDYCIFVQYIKVTWGVVESMNKMLAEIRINESEAAEIKAFIIKASEQLRESSPEANPASPSLCPEAASKLLLYLSQLLDQ